MEKQSNTKEIFDAGIKMTKKAAERLSAVMEAEGKKGVGVNVVGSGNTALCDIGFAPNAAWCIGSVSRGYSCATHALFSMKKGRAWAASKSEPMVQMLDLSMIKYVGPDDRPVPTQEEREKYAKRQKDEGEYKKWVI